MIPFWIIFSSGGQTVRGARYFDLEPLVVLVSESSRIVGLWVGPLEEKISLYLDDTLLYLHDADSSLDAALETFDEFGRFSKIHINWSKSALFPLDAQARVTGTQTPLQWVE